MTRKKSAHLDAEEVASDLEITETDKGITYSRDGKLVLTIVNHDGHCRFVTADGKVLEPSDQENIPAHAATAAAGL